mgnify:CR=1 FL=1
MMLKKFGLSTLDFQLITSNMYILKNITLRLKEKIKRVII